MGLVWSGGFRPSQPELWSVNNRRNIPLAKLAGLKNPDIEFYSLQKGQPAESELAELMVHGWDGPQIVDFTSLLNDFSDTAGLVENLDLVIAVDTSTAHLAGALGKPVWILNRFDTGWRWLLDREDSPWYPTARLFRQDGRASGITSSCASRPPYTNSGNAGRELYLDTRSMKARDKCGLWQELVDIGGLLFFLYFSHLP